MKDNSSFLLAHHPTGWIDGEFLVFSVSQPRRLRKYVVKIFEKIVRYRVSATDPGWTTIYNVASIKIRCASTAEDSPLVTKESKQ